MKVRPIQTKDDKNHELFLLKIKNGFRFSFQLYISIFFTVNCDRKYENLKGVRLLFSLTELFPK